MTIQVIGLVEQDGKMTEFPGLGSWADGEVAAAEAAAREAAASNLWDGAVLVFLAEDGREIERRDVTAYPAKDVG